MMSPSVYIHEVLTGTVVSGELPNVEPELQANGSPSYGGISQLFVGCASAGRIVAGPRGLTLISIGANLPGITGFTVNINDRGSLLANGASAQMQVLDHTIPEFVEHNADIESFMHTFRGGVMIPPGCSLEFVANQATTADGRIYFIVGPAFSAGSGYVSINSKT